MALYQEDPAEYLRILDDMLLEQKSLKREEIDQLVADRSQARVDKNWAESDRIRDDLAAKGIAVQDSPEGTIWEVAK